NSGQHRPGAPNRPWPVCSPAEHGRVGSTTRQARHTSRVMERTTSATLLAATTIGRDRKTCPGHIWIRTAAGADGLAVLRDAWRVERQRRPMVPGVKEPAQYPKNSLFDVVLDMSPKDGVNRFDTNPDPARARHRLERLAGYRPATILAEDVT